LHEASLRKFFNDKVDEVIRVDTYRMATPSVYWI